jgi:hypothetical protein
MSTFSGEGHICYFVMERLLRTNKQALNLNPEAADAGSSQVLWISGMISILLFIAAPFLNTYQIGYLRHVNIAVLS